MVFLPTRTEAWHHPRERAHDDGSHSRDIQRRKTRRRRRDIPLPGPPKSPTKLRSRGALRAGPPRGRQEDLGRGGRQGLLSGSGPGGGEGDAGDVGDVLGV